MKNQIKKVDTKMKNADDELNLIKDYLDELNYSTQHLYNTNYYNLHANEKARKTKTGSEKKGSDKKDKEEPSSVLNCIRILKNEKNKFKSIDSDKYSETDSESEENSCRKITNFLEKNLNGNFDLQSNREKKNSSNEATDVLRKSNQNSKKKKEKDLLQKEKGMNIIMEEPNKKNIFFSFKQYNGEKSKIKDSRFNECTELLTNQKQHEIFEQLRSNSKKKNTNETLNDNHMLLHNYEEKSSDSMLKIQKEPKNNYRKQKNGTAPDPKEGTLFVYEELSNRHHNDLYNAFGNDKKKKKKSNRKGKGKGIHSNSNSTSTSTSEYENSLKKKIMYNDDSSEVLSNSSDNIWIQKHLEKTKEKKKTHIKNKKNSSTYFNKFPITREMNLLKMKDLKDQVDDNIFMNEREKELFQFLISKALNEMENISYKLEHKYKKDLIENINKIKNENQDNIKKLLKDKCKLSYDNERKTEQEKDQKELIKKLENAKNLLREEVEKLRKKNEAMQDKYYKQELQKSNEEIKVKKLQDEIQSEKKQVEEYEKKIKMLHEDLHENYEKSFYYQNKWNDSEKIIHHKENEIEGLKREIEQYIKENKDITEQLKYLQGEKSKLEMNCDSLKNELNKTKLQLVKIQNECKENLQNKDDSLTLFKNKEKQMREDLENYKTKCVHLENKRDTHILEEKIKHMEYQMKELETEKDILERTCVKNEKIQKDMELEMKNLKNELYECKHKLHALKKDSQSYSRTTLRDIEIPSETLKERSSITKDLFKSDIENNEEPTIDAKDPLNENPLDIKQKISSLEKQLILLKLEKTNKESELIRCPKYGRKKAEIKNREFIETKLKYLDDKINMLNKQLKYIRMSKEIN